MTPRTARWIAWAIVVLYFTLAAAGLTLQGLARTSYTQTTLPVLILLVSLVGVWIVTGALIISRHPRHPVGWLLCAGLITGAIDMFAAGYAVYDTYVYSGSLPGVALALIWLKLVYLGPHGLAVFTLIVLLFPDGRFPSPGWRKVAWTTVGTLLIFLPLQAVEPGSLDPSFLPDRTNPLGVSASSWVTLKPLMWTAFIILVLCYGAALVSLIVRLRNSRGDIRQQIKWLLFPVGLYGIFLLLFMIGTAKANEVIVNVGIALGQLAVAGMVIAVAFAIFKYRLYDVDLILNRTLVYGALTACVVGLYVLVVGGMSLVVQSNSIPSGTLLTTALVLVLFKPLRTLLRRGVDRLVPVGKTNAGIPASSMGESPGRSFDQRQETFQGPVRDDQAKETIIRLPVRMRPFLRAMWFFWAAISWGIFIFSVPAYLIVSTAGLNVQLAAPDASWLVVAVNGTSFSVRVVAALFSLVLASMIFHKRPDDRMALFLTYFFLVYGVVVAGPLAFLEPLKPGISTFALNVIQPVLFAPFLVTFLCIFPNGRFVPDRTCWLVLASLLYAPISPLLLNADALFGTATINIMAKLLSFSFVFAGIYAQIYRYRYVSSPTERQQMKWVIYGFTLALLFALFSSLRGFALLRQQSETVSSLGGLGWSLAITALPISLAFAVMRYRLYDIDSLINRTLVYGALTASVVAIYALLVGAMGVLFQAQGNLVIALLATGLVAVLFQPLREWLQRGVNRLIFGERDDPVEALSRLGESLETALPPEQVLPTLVETIAQTLKLPFVGIAIQDQPVAAFGQPTKNPVAFPLIFRGESTGELLAAPRGPDESFTPAELRLLQNLARQAGAAVRNAQLTTDLQRSRQKLVTAREEERLRLRRDLHDGLGPALASVIWQVDSARDIVSTNPSEAVQLLESSIDEAQGTLADIRRLVYGLRPPALDELGLIGALEQATRQHQQISVVIEAVDPFPVLPAAVEVAAYRIVQEALKNAIEHGKAQNCLVCLALGDGSVSGSLCLTIQDDGIGLPEVITPGVGLASMRERAEELGGTFKIHSRRVSGTEIEVCLPLD